MSKYVPPHLRGKSDQTNPPTGAWSKGPPRSNPAPTPTAPPPTPGRYIPPTMRQDSGGRGRGTSQGRGQGGRGRGTYVPPHHRQEEPPKPEVPDLSKFPDLAGETKPANSTITKPPPKLQGVWGQLQCKGETLAQKLVDEPQAPQVKVAKPEPPPQPEPEPEPEPEHGSDSEPGPHVVEDYDEIDQYMQQIRWEEEQRQAWDDMEWDLERRYEIHFHFFKHFRRGWLWQNYRVEEFRLSQAHKYDREQFLAEAEDYFDYMDEEYGTTEEAKDRYHAHPEMGWRWAVSGWRDDPFYGYQPSPPSDDEEY